MLNDKRIYFVIHLVIFLSFFPKEMSIFFK